MVFILKTETVAKLFFFMSCTGLFMYAMLAFYTFHTAYSSMAQLQKFADNMPGLSMSEYKIKMRKYSEDLKYILLWTILSETNVIGEGQEPFIARNCLYTNCYLTSDKYLLNKNYTNFDAIILNVSMFQMTNKKTFPKSRSSHQKYIFYSAVSSDDSPVCITFTDNYFNWTWTYRLDSDIFGPFIEVKDLEGNLVAPKPFVNWISNLTVSESDVAHLKQKRKAVAWISKKCETRNNRMAFAKRLQRAFKANALNFDIFGCGQQDCPKDGCFKAIERDYYFYYASEDSNAIDYVTNEVVIAYNNNAVPIVFGEADYRKFIPEGSYINAGTVSVDKLVAMVEYIMRNPEIYYSFHRWRKNYIINEAERFKGICEICEYLNDANKFETESVKKDFRKWWYSRPLYERCFPKGAESYSELLSYVNESRVHYNF